MKITDEDVFYKIHGEETVDEEYALAMLLSENVVFANSMDYMCEGEKEGHTVVLFVNANDIFMWACADGMDIEHHEIGELYKMHRADEKWGSIKWCCKKRNLKPQKPIVDDMKKEGVWDDMMEALKDNG